MSRHSRESNYSINTSGSVSVGFEFVDGGASLFSGRQSFFFFLAPPVAIACRLTLSGRVARRLVFFEKKLDVGSTRLFKMRTLANSICSRIPCEKSRIFC